MLILSSYQTSSLESSLHFFHHALKVKFGTFKSGIHAILGVTQLSVCLIHNGATEYRELDALDRTFTECDVMYKWVQFIIPRSAPSHLFNMDLSICFAPSMSYGTFSSGVSTIKKVTRSVAIEINIVHSDKVQRV